MVWSHGVLASIFFLGFLPTPAGILQLSVLSSILVALEWYWSEVPALVCGHVQAAAWLRGWH